MSSKKVYYSWDDVEHMVHTINNLMAQDDWRPDYIVGLTRGGLVPAVMLSNITGIKLHTLDARYDEEGGGESNLWMAEDAYGFNHEYDDNYYHCPTLAKNILIVDDINNNGKTFEWLLDDWRSGCCPDSPKWDDVFGGNVRVATLVDNVGSQYEDVDYAATEIDKREQDTWSVFPWEGERNYGAQL